MEAMEKEKAAREVARLIGIALNDPAIAEDVSTLTIAMCRMNGDERARVIGLAFGIIDNRLTAAEITRQRAERERLRVPGTVVVPGDEA